MPTCDTSVEPFVSVVLPCFNSRATIGECLRSLEQQTYPRSCFEVIVADNGSTDGSTAWIAEKYPQVRLERAQAKGSANARNAGFHMARGKWILSIDSDCVADPNWISTLVNAMRMAPERVAAIGGYIAPFSKATWVEQYQPAWVAQPDLADPNGKVRYTATPNAIFDRAAVNSVGGFDASAGHDDTDLGMRLTAAGYRCLFVPEAIVQHRNPSGVVELYQHRRKYGERNYILSQRHRVILGSPEGMQKRKQLLHETVNRIIRNAIKLPLSLIYRPKSAPAGWPILDAVMAWGNYRGFRDASLLDEQKAA